MKPNARKETLSRTVRLLTKNSIPVTFRGSTPFVLSDKRDGSVVRLNLPEIPDDAPEMLIDALQGYLDHECGHIFYTPFIRIPDDSKKAKLANVFEDIRLEKLLPRDLPGTRDNLERMYRNWIPLIIQPGIDKGLASGDPGHMLAVLLVPAMRALGGQQVFVELMDRNNYWQHIDTLMRRLSNFGDRIKAMESYDDVLACVDILHDAMTPPPPPPPPPAPPPPPPAPEPAPQSEPEPTDEPSDQSEPDGDNEADEPGDQSEGDEATDEGSDDDDGAAGGGDDGDDDDGSDHEDDGDEGSGGGDEDGDDAYAGADPDADDDADAGDDGADDDEDANSAGDSAGGNDDDREDGDDEDDADDRETDEGDSDEDDRGEPDADDETVAGDGKNNRTMMDALALLDPTLRRALYLHKKRNKSVDEIAGEMNVSADRAAEMLRETRRGLADLMRN